MLEGIRRDVINAPLCMSFLNDLATLVAEHER